MERERLRGVQAPLKERYREQPEAARVTLRASGSLGEGVSCSVDTGRALAEAGLHPATGGDGWRSTATPRSASRRSASASSSTPTPTPTSSGRS